MSDASGSIASTNTSARSSSMPVGSPGDILRAATSKLSAQHAISKLLSAVMLCELTIRMHGHTVSSYMLAPGPAHWHNVTHAMHCIEALQQPYPFTVQTTVVLWLRPSQ
jgi:hypothetical protein